MSDSEIISISLGILSIILAITTPIILYKIDKHKEKIFFKYCFYLNYKELINFMQMPVFSINLYSNNKKNLKNMNRASKIYKDVSKPRMVFILKIKSLFKTSFSYTKFNYDSNSIIDLVLKSNLINQYISTGYRFFKEKTDYFNDQLMHPNEIRNYFFDFVTNINGNKPEWKEEIKKEFIEKDNFIFSNKKDIFSNSNFISAYRACLKKIEKDEIKTNNIKLKNIDIKIKEEVKNSLIWLLIVEEFFIIKEKNKGRPFKEWEVYRKDNNGKIIHHKSEKTLFDMTFSENKHFEDKLIEGISNFLISFINIRELILISSSKLFSKKWIAFFYRKHIRNFYKENWDINKWQKEKVKNIKKKEVK